eukprot:9125210-Lingulodinium_polyedra.AAC.1
MGFTPVVRFSAPCAEGGLARTLMSPAPFSFLCTEGGLARTPISCPRSAVSGLARTLLRLAAF